MSAILLTGFALPLALTGCGEAPGDKKPIDKKPGDSGSGEDSGTTGDSGSTGDTGVEQLVDYSEIKADYEKDGDEYLCDHILTDKPEYVDMIKSGQVTNVPKSVLTHTMQDLFDMDDSESSVNPGATEICDGFDNDQDGAIDNNAEDATTWYRDADEDGYGSATDTVIACEQPEGYLGHDSDIDDADPNTYPGADEICDAKDNDQDGFVDEGLETYVFYRDADGDGYGDISERLESCDPATPEGYVTTADDCDDTDPDLYGGVLYYEDIDGDLFGGEPVLLCESDPLDYVSVDGDCNDTNAAINPDALEVCDEVDNNCDGETDEGVTSTFFIDSDADGFGTAASSIAACEVPDGYALTDDDCDDSVSSVYPGAAEVCDDLDNNCDGEIDEGVTTAFYVDSDADGYGSSTSSVLACEVPDGYALTDDDCDDDNVAVNPGAAEVCDDLDNNCDDEIDNGLETYTFYADSDEDGYGDASIAIDTCYTSLSGYVSDATDCDDSEAGIHALIDYHVDADGDTWGASETEAFCLLTAPEGFVDRNNDCDDTSASTYPGASEVCDGVDNNCDDEIDNDAEDALTWFLDADSDDYGTSASSVLACEQPDGYADNSDDCNDDNADVNPAVAEVANNGLDDDCDADTVIQLEGEYDLGDVASRIFPSSTSNAALGFAVAGLGDLNGDGYEEYAISKPDFSYTAKGRVNVVYGDEDSYGSFVSLEGEAVGDLTGYAVANAGDVDGDGVNDLLVGAPLEDTSGLDAGSVYFVSGDSITSGSLASVAATVFRAENSYDALGLMFSVGQGDLSGDGNLDVVLSSPSYGSDFGHLGNGAVYVGSEPDSGEINVADFADTKIVGATSTDGTGASTSVSDVDGDGIDDLLVSSYQNRDIGVLDSEGSGRSDVFLGDLPEGEITIEDSDVSFFGEAGGDLFGFTSLLSDLNNDGYADLLSCSIGYEDGTGACHLFLSAGAAISGDLFAGEDETAKFVGYDSGAHLGTSVVVGDINGDGYLDLVVGESAEYLSSHSSHIGGAYVLYGPLGETGTADMIDVADVFLQGENRTDYAGTSVGAGDFNADGKDDVIIGAPFYDYSGSIENSGAAYVVEGSGL